MDSTKFEVALVGDTSKLTAAERLTAYNNIATAAAKQQLGLMYVLT